MSWAWLIKRCFPSQTNVSSGTLDAIDSNIFAAFNKLKKFILLNCDGKMKLRSLFLTAALTLSCVPFAARETKAAVVWTISGAQFDDGGTLSGSFTITSGFLSTWNLTTTAGSKLPGAPYGPLNFNSAYEKSLGTFPNGAPLNSVDVSDKTVGFLPSNSTPYQGELFIQFQNSLSGGGIDPIVGGYECFGFSCSPQTAGGPTGDIRFFNLDSKPFASAVPEPSTWAMMILGFAGLGFLTYRRSRKSVAIAA